MSIVNRISAKDFEALEEAFAYLTQEGWQIPEWLAEWGVSLGYLKEIADD